LFVEAVRLLYSGGGFVLASLHQLPPFSAFTVCLDDGVLSFSFLLDFGEVAFEVVEFIGHSFEFLLGVDFGVGEREHLLVVGVDQVDELSLVGGLFAFGLVFEFEVLISEFL
jgi:hypothetical protein